MYDDGVEYDAGQAHREQLTQAVSLYQSFKGQIVANHPSKMIYVMGPPRCGGSLIQSILARLENVVSVGERGALIPWLLNCLTSPQNAAQLISQLGSSDLSGMQKSYGDAETYVDKTSPHILFAGLLSLVHPGSKFVVPTRSSSDMAVSMYFHDFPPEFSYARSIRGIEAYLNIQKEATEAWASEGLDLVMHDHDQFTANPDIEGPQLFKALDLPWSEHVLNPEAGESVTRTFSARQVTEQVSKKFSGRGERYADFLQKDGFSL
jgi:hypothetical protein